MKQRQKQKNYYRLKLTINPKKRKYNDNLINNFNNIINIHK